MGSKGLPNFINELDPPRLHYTMEIQRNLGLELRVKGVAQQEMDFL